MIWPLVVLALPTVFAGFWGVEQLLGTHAEAGVPHEQSTIFDQLFAPFNHAPASAFAGLAAAGFGFFAARQLYRNATTDPLPEMLGPLARVIQNRFYIDEVYEKVIAYTQDALAHFTDLFDRWIVAGLLVKGVHGTTELAGRALRLLQTGNLQTYALLFATGVAALLYLVLSNQ